MVWRCTLQPERVPNMKNLKSDKKMLTRRQLAERWACSTETIKRLERYNRLRRSHVVGHARYPLDAIEEYERNAEVN